MTPNEVAALVLGELGDTAEAIWTTTEILGYLQAALYDFKTRTLCSWKRAALNDVAGDATYTVPSDFHQLDRAEYDYWPVNPIPPRVQMAGNGYFESASNRPFAIMMEGDGLLILRKIGVPVIASTVFYLEYYSWGLGVTAGLLNTDIDLPDRYLNYVAHRIKMQAYKRDGDGQSLKMAQFWAARYEDGINMVHRRRERLAQRRIGNIGNDGKVPESYRVRDPGTLPPYFPIPPR